MGTGLTQEGLATRSGVSVSTLRKFERTGLISLESFLKLAMVLGILDLVVEATVLEQKEFSSIDDVLIVAKVFALSTPTLTLPLPGGGNCIDRKNLCND